VYFITAHFACQELFSSFSKLFEVLSAETLLYRAVALASDSIRIPHSIPFVKHFFRAFSNSFVLTGLGECPSLERLPILPEHSSFVNTFFQVFSGFFAPFSPQQYLPL
ncbi:hypothetical protein, partial [Pseudoflavonifractor sp. AF19-9AC]|uniref:hypothetical protein n=1 Tax=Pseudoflavonifractor sp. AF19-9AC TaxID=2292244 RepID=UPI001314FAD9